MPKPSKPGRESSYNPRCRGCDAPIRVNRNAAIKDGVWCFGCRKKAKG